MKTNFSVEEMYEAYNEEVMRCLVEDHKLTAREGEQLLSCFDFKRKFLANVSDFEFLEPSRLAVILIG